MIGTMRSTTLCSSDGSEEEDDGENSEELDSADTGPSGECLTNVQIVTRGVTIWDLAVLRYKHHSTRLKSARPTLDSTRSLVCLYLYRTPLPIYQTMNLARRDAA